MRANSGKNCSTWNARWGFRWNGSARAAKAVRKKHAHHADLNRLNVNSLRRNVADTIDTNAVDTIAAHANTADLIAANIPGQFRDVRCTIVQSTRTKLPLLWLAEARGWNQIHE